MVSFGARVRSVRFFQGRLPDHIASPSASISNNRARLVAKIARRALTLTKAFRLRAFDLHY